jgi:SepF-like predicted cell division protein (DUF552 family)
MPLKDFFEKFRSPQEYLELEIERGEMAPEKLSIQVERMNTYEDSDRIQRKVREGLILLVKIKNLREKDMNELKRAIARVRKTCIAMDGDIAGIGNDWIIVTPPKARVHREMEK